VNVEIHAHAAALVVALVRAGELDVAESFVEWALENLDYDLQETVDNA
jgi:hypothetical protein